MFAESDSSLFYSLFDASDSSLFKFLKHLLSYLRRVGNLKSNFNIFPVSVINIKSLFSNYAFFIYYLFYSKSV